MKQFKAFVFLLAAIFAISAVVMCSDSRAQGVSLSSTSTFPYGTFVCSWSYNEDSFSYMFIAEGKQTGVSTSAINGKMMLTNPVPISLCEQTYCYTNASSRIAFGAMDMVAVIKANGHREFVADLLFDKRRSRMTIDMDDGMSANIKNGHDDISMTLNECQ